MGAAGTVKRAAALVLALAAGTAAAIAPAVAAPRDGGDGSAPPAPHSVPPSGSSGTVNHIAVTVDENGVLNVRETLSFGEEAAPEFTRSLAVREGFDATYDRLFEVSGVTAGSDAGEVGVETDEHDGVLDIVLDRGDAATAVLDYRVTGALEEIEGGVELEWTPVAGYSEPVEQTSVQIDAPQPPRALSCSAGDPRSSIYCTSSDMGGHEALTARFLQVDMVPGERFSVVAAYPEGTAKAEPVLERPWSLSSAFAVTPVTGSVFGVLLLGLLGGLAALIRLRGQEERALREESGAATNAPLESGPDAGLRFRPPDGVHPGQIGTLMDGQADVVDIAASVVDLAVRGHFTIEELPHENAAVDWVLSKRVPPADEELLPYESQLIEALFERRVRVRLSHLHRFGFGRRLSGVRDELYRDMVRLKWFANRPNVERNRWATAGIALTVGGVAVTVLLAAFTQAAFTGLAVVIAGAALTVGAQYMPSRTTRGSQVLAHTLGFRAFLMSAEAEHVPEQRRVELFSRYLPYAVIFDNVDRWAAVLAAAGAGEEQAEGAEQASPLGWYTGPSDWDVADFAESITAFTLTLSGVIAGSRQFGALD